MKQLGLPILLNAKMRLGNFIGVKNAQVLSFVNTLFTDNNSSVVIISGDKSSGKTHFLQGCTFAAMKRQLNAIYIDTKEVFPDDFIADLSYVDWVCIDNIENLTDLQQQELFNLYNQIKHTHTKLIISASNLPTELNLLNDLKTRLSLGVSFTLEQLTDKQKITILQEKMIDKNININTNVYLYLFKHYSRDLNKLLNAIDRLDEASLQQKSKISVPLIKNILQVFPVQK